ncbi:hypothetical protein Tco_1054775 [Tanacetum coccineum]|uniref:Uncharacterized protein n=1 Tax=Tanacetum coccineum TaxID=301880 RepID=A0ABQ5GXS7_9ASTR
MLSNTALSGIPIQYNFGMFLLRVGRLDLQDRQGLTSGIRAVRNLNKKNKSNPVYNLNLKTNCPASQDEIPPPPPSSPQTPTQQTPHTVSTIKLPILKKGEYDIWAMKMEHYLAHTDYPIWREDHLAKFHKMTNAKEMWDAIKSRFGGNDESKKMQKFQSLLSQLEIHGAGELTESKLDDLYNNLSVFESDVKGSTASSSSPQNVAFISENTSIALKWTLRSWNILTEYDIERNGLEVASGMFNENEKVLQEDCRNLQFDAKEPFGFDKKPSLNVQLPKIGHFASECSIRDNQGNRRRDAWNSRTKDGSRTGKKEDSKALVTIDGEGVDWTNHSEEDEDYALMACKAQTQTQREQLSEASIEIKAYSQGLKKVEAHEAQKKRRFIKAKVEKWHNSSKNLSKLLNTQMSTNDKFGLGYGDHRYDGILSYENEVLQSVFMNKESELEKQPLYDRFVTAEGMHAVPPPMTGNYMPSRPVLMLDYSNLHMGPSRLILVNLKSQNK